MHLAVIVDLCVRLTVIEYECEKVQGAAFA